MCVVKWKYACCISIQKNTNQEPCACLWLIDKMSTLYPPKWHIIHICHQDVWDDKGIHLIDYPNDVYKYFGVYTCIAVVLVTARSPSGVMDSSYVRTPWHTTSGPTNLITISRLCIHCLTMIMITLFGHILQVNIITYSLSNG